MAHNLFRWLVIGTGFSLLYLLFYRPQDHKHFLWAFNQVFLYQIGFGLILYLGVSPIARIALANPEMLKGNIIFRFWAIIHGPCMLLALALFYLGKFSSKKCLPDKRIKVLRLTVSFTMLIILLANPWPFLEYGRPLIRLFYEG